MVSDGSVDDTYQVPVGSGADIVIKLEKNYGKGYAIMEDLKYAKHSIILLVDADLRGLNYANLLV